jgi:hypothetical protein
MATTKQPTEDELQRWAAAAIRSLGPRGAARALGLSRDVLLSLAAGAPIRPMTRLAALAVYAARPRGGSAHSGSVK